MSILQVTSYKLQATSYKLQATSYKLQVTSYKLQATSYKLRVTSYKGQLGREVRDPVRLVQLAVPRGLEHLGADAAEHEPRHLAEELVAAC